MATTYTGSDGKKHSIFMTKKAFKKKFAEFEELKHRISVYKSLFADIGIVLRGSRGSVIFTHDKGVAITPDRIKDDCTPGIFNAFAEMITHMFWCFITLCLITGVAITLHKYGYIDLNNVLDGILRR